MEAERRECRCFLCGEMIVATCEEDCNKHMAQCRAFRGVHPEGGGTNPEYFRQTSSKRRGGANPFAPPPAFFKGDIVLVHGLASSAGLALNRMPARVLADAPENAARVSVVMLGAAEDGGADRRQLSIRPSNLLRARVADERAAALAEHARGTHPGLCAARAALARGFGDVEASAGLSRRIAAFVASPQDAALVFGGALPESGA